MGKWNESRLTCPEYKGFTGTADWDDDAGSYHGRLNGIADIITFDGDTPEEVEQAFRDSVDDYLEFCDRRGRRPARP